jgi:hypothetical protein
MGTEIAAAVLVCAILEMRVAIHGLKRETRKMSGLSRDVRFIGSNCEQPKVRAHFIAATLGLVLLMVGACAVPVRAYPPRDADGKPTALPVTIVKNALAPVEPAGFDWLGFLTVAGSILAGGGLGGVTAHTLTRKKKEA